MNSQISMIQQLCQDKKILWSFHATIRMQDRLINRSDVINCILSGKIIENYPNDSPFPSCLIFGYAINNKILHVVGNNNNTEIYIITAYYPDNIKFHDALKTRRL